MPIILSYSRNISLWIHASSKALTLSCWRFLSYRSQSTDLFCKSMDWFLYNRDLRHERFKTSSSAYIESLFLHAVKHNLLFYLCGFSFTNIHDSQNSRWRGMLSPCIISTTSTHFTDTCTLAGVLAVESSPLCIVGCRNRTWNLLHTVQNLLFLHLHW